MDLNKFELEFKASYDAFVQYIVSIPNHDDNDFNIQSYFSWIVNGKPKSFKGIIK